MTYKQLQNNFRVLQHKWYELREAGKREEANIVWNQSTVALELLKQADLTHIPPHVSLTATLIARYPTKMRATAKSSLTVIQYQQKTSNSLVW